MSKLTFALGSYRFTTDEKWLTYKSPYGKSFRVLLSDIKTTSLDLDKAGKANVKVLGAGTELASVNLPKPWAEKAQEFILSEAHKVRN